MGCAIPMAIGGLSINNQWTSWTGLPICKEGYVGIKIKKQVNVDL